MRLRCDRCEIVLDVVDTNGADTRPLTAAEFVDEFSIDTAALGWPYCPGNLAPALPLDVPGKWSS